MDNAALQKDDKGFLILPKDYKQKKCSVFELSANMKIPYMQIQSMACGESVAFQESVAGHAMLRRVLALGPWPFDADIDAEADIDGGGGAAKYDDDDDSDSDTMEQVE